MTEAVKALLVTEAAAQHEPYPQYAGHWDAWSVGRLKRDVKSRGALIGSKGDFVLYDPESFTTAESPDVLAGYRAPGMVTVYLPRHYAGGCDASIKATYLDALSCDCWPNGAVRCREHVLP